MNNKELIDTFLQNPSQLRAPEYLRALQLYTVEHNELLKTFCNKDELLGTINGMASSIPTKQNDIDDVVEQHYIFSPRNLVQQMVDDLLHKSKLTQESEIGDTVFAGFMPTLQ